ncbi:Chitin-binding type-2 domain-containing protein [Camponotus japonicus]
MKGIYTIAIFFLASWNVIANEDFVQDKSESIREKDLRQIFTRCPLYDENETVILAHETDCTKAYKCSWGKRYPLDCPWIDDRKTEKLHFNLLKQYCDWPWDAGCIDCPGNANDGYPSIKISHDINNCNLYYQCVNGVKQLRSCSSGLCFSATCQDCVRNRTGGNCE